MTFFGGLLCAHLDWCPYLINFEVAYMGAGTFLSLKGSKAGCLAYYCIYIYIHTTLDKITIDVWFWWLDHVQRLSFWNIITIWVFISSHLKSFQMAHLVFEKLQSQTQSNPGLADHICGLNDTSSDWCCHCTNHSIFTASTANYPGS